APGAPGGARADRLSREAGRRDVVVALDTVDGERVGRLLVPNRDHGLQPGHDDTGGVTVDADPVPVVRTFDDDVVGLAVALPSAERRCQIEVHRADVGARQVAYRDAVGPAEGVEVAPLDPRRVHRHVAGGTEDL